MSHNINTVLYKNAPHPSLFKVSDGLERLFAQEKSLEEGFFHLKAAFTKAISGDWVKDVSAIEVSINKLFNLCRHYIESCQSENTQVDFWNHARHDLRACVGCIKGYAELLLEEQGDVAQAASPLKTLMSQSVVLLDIIDSIRLENQNVEENTPRQEQEEYASCFVGSFVARGTILIIDDDPTKRSLIVRRLEDGGHKVIEAEGGVEGLRIIEKYEIDLILLDILMPGMSGHEVLAQLKGNAATQYIPVLVISHLSNEDNAIQCIRAGAEDYLIAPVNPTLLQARINACLIKKNLADLEKKQTQELLVAQERLEAALESIDVGFAILDKNSRFVMKNSAFEDLYLPLKNKNFTKITYEEFLSKTYEDGCYLKEKRGVLIGAFQPDPFPNWLEERLYHFNKADGSPIEERLSDERWIEIVHKPIESGGVATLHKDITVQKHRENATLYRADHDNLTGLANRAFFERVLNMLCSQTSGHHALIFIDLDGFKRVNDTLGHAFGDFLLTSVAQKLKAVFRDEDMVGRLGGDEFCVLVHDVNNINFIEKLAKRCLDAVGTYVEKDGIRANFGMSMGIALYPTDAQNGDDLLVCADSAMYQAKRSGKGTYIFYENLEN